MEEQDDEDKKTFVSLVY